MKSLEKHPDVKNRLDLLCESRCDEILTQMLENDSEYNRLFDKRSDASMALKNAIIGTEADELLEEYTDAVIEQEVYEQNTLYRQAVNDVLAVLRDCGLLWIDSYLDTLILKYLLKTGLYGSIIPFNFY